MEFETKAIHSGQEPDSLTGAVVVPIYQTSTFLHDEPGVHRGYAYSRAANPTRSALESCLKDLEGAEFGFAFASGMAAEDAVLRMLGPGDHVLSGDDLYGGTRRLLDTVLSTTLEHSSVDMGSVEAAAAALRPNTKIIWIETPSNPHLRITDIAAICEMAREKGILTLCDNTFASPFLQRPISLGADIVLHSTTKYLGGHSDVVGGAVCTSNEAVAQHLGAIQKAAGAIPGPFDSWLVLRGIKTLALRMRKHSENAAKIAQFLVEHPAVERVAYPGLPDDTGHQIAARQMDGFGGMVSFELNSAEAALKTASRTKLFFLAESLGGVESLLGYPAKMSHASVAGGEYAVSDKLIRLSVGIEDPDDLIADLRQAIEGP